MLRGLCPGILLITSSTLLLRLQEHSEARIRLDELSADDIEGLDKNELELNWEIELKGEEGFMEEEDVIIGEENDEGMEER